MHERWSLIVNSPLQSHHMAQRELGPFSAPRKIPMPRGSDAKSQGWAHTRSLSFRIQVLRQKIHQLERTSAIDYLVDQITLTARQLLDHALRRGPDGFVGPMDTCREQQYERGISEVHGRTQKNIHRSLTTLVFSLLAPTKRCLAVSIFRLPHKGKQAKKDG